jgi:hypothetical protein
VTRLQRVLLLSTSLMVGAACRWRADRLRRADRAPSFATATRSRPPTPRAGGRARRRRVPGALRHGPRARC